MKYFYFIFLSLFSINSFAQLTLTKAANEPVVGDTFTNSVINEAVDNAPTGNGVTFNNPTFTASASAVNVFSAPSSTEITTYPNSNLRHFDGISQNVFYKITATTAEITGTVNTQYNLNYNVDNAIAYTYPIAYGYTNTDASRGVFTFNNVPGIGTYTGYMQGTINTTADAAGTLIIGSNTYTNVLRLKTLQNISLYAITDPTLTTPRGTLTNTVYQYYHSSSKFPLISTNAANATIPEIGYNNAFSYVQAQTQTLGIEETTGKNTLSIYPNPASEKIFINSDVYKTAEFVNANGQMVKTANITENGINVQDLKFGMYLIILQGENITNVQKIIIK